MHFSTISLVSLLATSATSLGINCRGSGVCPISSPHDTVFCRDGNVMQRFRCFANSVDQGRTYHDGDHIACIQSSFVAGNHGTANGAYCLFPQGSNGAGGISGSKVPGLVQDLLDHKCTRCGSVPQDFPGSNDPGHGILTSNYVDGVNPCNGLC